jgi:hypothetical protein
MLLGDLRLAFAQELIGHWTRIRDGELVPLKDRIDPREMRRALPFITIADVSRPDAPEIRLAGTGLRPRYGQEITGTDWSKFVPPTSRAALQMVVGLIVGTPCGVYYRFKVSANRDVMREAETVGLPLRVQGADRPTMTITFTRDIALQGIADPSSVEAARVENMFAEFVDIGAGIPGGSSAGAEGGSA